MTFLVVIQMSNVKKRIKKPFFFSAGIHLRKVATVQDVVVSCCILHNMRKLMKQRHIPYSQQERQQQITIGRDVLVVETQHIDNQNPFRIQNYLAQNFF